jgi:hypothetical protein
VREGGRVRERDMEATVVEGVGWLVNLVGNHGNRFEHNPSGSSVIISGPF